MAVEFERRRLIETDGDLELASDIPDIDTATRNLSDTAVRLPNQSRVAKVFLGAAAVFAFVCLASLAFASTSSIDANDSGNPFRELEDDEQAKHTRDLTANYAQVRFSNDVPAVLELYAPDSTLDIDTSSLNWLVSRNIRSKVSTHLGGPARISNYYNAFPTQGGDPTPEPASFECAANTCIIRESVHRSFFTIRTKAVFKWNGEDQIESLKLKLS
jgi:hypothetical protein